VAESYERDWEGLDRIKLRSNDGRVQGQIVNDAPRLGNALCLLQCKGIPNFLAVGLLSKFRLASHL